MTNSTNLPGLGIPIIQPKGKRVKVKVSPSMLPMFATICPVQIVGSEKSEEAGVVVLVLESEDLPDVEWCTLMCERDGTKSVVDVVGING